jgi:hypothetical protein
MRIGCLGQRMVSSPLPPHLSSFHSGMEASVIVSAHQPVKSVRGTIGKLLGLKWGRDGAHALPASVSPTLMLTQDERDAAMTWRARAAAELQSIREDGLLGRNWRKHPRTIVLLGYLSGTSTAIQTDNAARN